MHPVDVCFKQMQSLSTVVPEQEAMLDTLASDLKGVLEMRGPLNATALMEKARDDAYITAKDLCTARRSVRDLSVGLGHFALSRVSGLADENKQQLGSVVGKLFLAALERV